MQISHQNSCAVSPVVGVMLMLVVTIIIAAVVSAFSGGISQSTSKAPHLTFSAEARNNSYIIIDVSGGDPISASSVTIRTFIPSGTYKDMSHEVNLTNAISLSTGSLVKTADSAVTIQTGDKIRINWGDAFAPSCWEGVCSGYVAPSVGEPVKIEIYDSASGKAIATTQTNILP